MLIIDWHFVVYEILTLPKYKIQVHILTMSTLALSNR